ncbi:glycine betaine ABC transporter substrate-binding protein [Natrialbaceae archaeon AArc-T1-2]|uniref:glycine betaine ABC transporter substrate-binding protein n=1 Tax=Natrialbaceae archaeon AArc-T1-2 TaxID=3053904 RepID=UPI00255AC003|nr:glycine betaine ABC transporter substrate-binding protein [Natrialbaceae archaeon AArc-T1-2]WIV66402.1 glycine betaine ABC transporter substrate-binding protein [Natrialbaceae archaeon AArc-T1-2]
MTGHTSRRTLLKTTGAAIGTAGLTGLAGCTGMLGGGDVAIGSKDFTEQHVLGQLAIEAIEANTDLGVADETGLGGTIPNFEALDAGEIDLYWEYTGTMWLAIPPEQDGIIEDPDELYEEASEIMDEQHDVAVLEKAPLNNTYQILATSEWHDEHGVETLSEFAEFADDGDVEDTDLVLGPEFQEREDDGWPGLIEHYDFSEAAIETLDDNTETVNEDVVYAAIGEEDQGDIGMGFATDPRIPLYDLQILEDDESFFPTYNAAPMVRNDTLDDHPEIADALEEIPPLLDNDTISELNMEVAEEGRSASAVATEFLDEHDLI